MMNPTDGLVLLTGCGSGIGKALARAFHAAGMPVLATSRRAESLQDLAASGIETQALDVTQADAVSALVARLQSEGRAIGMLVNNAGHGSMGPMLDVPADEWQRQFDVNLFAPLALVRAVLPGMIARGRGQVVNISSVSGVTTTPFAGPYCASKAALNAASDALRMELAPLGIRVVTVQPGGIRSAFGDQAAAGVHLAPDSPYQAVREGVMARANESQSAAMPAEEFARRLVARLARADCPPVVRIGPKSRLLPWIGTWLPVRLRDRMLSRRFGLDGLGRA